MYEFGRWNRERYRVLWALLDRQKSIHGLMYEFGRWDRERYLVVWTLLDRQKSIHGLMYEFGRWDRERYLVLWALLDRQKSIYGLMYEFGRWGYGTSNSHCTVGNLIFFSLHIEVVGAFNRFVNHLRLLVIDLLDCLQTSQTLEPFQRQAHHVNPASIYQLFWRATAHGTSLRPVFYRLSVLTRMLVECCRANTFATLFCSQAQLDTLWPLFRLSLVGQWRSSLRLDQRFSEHHRI